MSFDAALLSLSLLEQCGNLDGQSRQVAIEYAPDDFIPEGVTTAFHLPSDGACTGFSML